MQTDQRVSATSSGSVDDLLEQTARGDKTAFAALYDSVAPAVYGIAVNVVRDPSMAEEVAHDALLNVWESGQSFNRARGSARAWIMTIAHRRAVDVVRSEQAARDRLMRIGTRTLERSYDEVSESVCGRVEVALVRQALGVLTALERESITLAYFGGFTHREVAEILQVPLGTVKSRISTGLRRLRSELAEVA
ncbi:ECF RNA polymerase sigma factor SigK [soil metagenome]